jgi:linoleoyl-CoA desaturase
MSAIAPSKPQFERDAGFHADLKRRVAAHFESAGTSTRGGFLMYLKTAAILGWFVASYVLLVFVVDSWWLGIPLAASLALAIAGIGFNIQHDANHRAYSKNGLVNRLLGGTLDMLGASSYVWRWKHNVFHHSYTNVSGADDDIDIVPFGRLAPSQPHHGIHRFQQFYLWVLYGLLLFKWHFVHDFKAVVSARIAGNDMPRPRGWALVELVGAKTVFFGWALVVPLFFHRWWVVLAVYAAVWFIVGVILSVVFQLAHCVDETAFAAVDRSGGAALRPWAIHQVESTVDFAPRNRALTWYLGGLNFQIEHHLFPGICHLHYPRIAAIVQAVSAEHGVRYVAHEGFFTAVRSHWRLLRRMGGADAQGPAT